MASVAQILPQVLPPRQVPQRSVAWLDTLNYLRAIALQCRVAARTDLFEACAMLSDQKDIAQDAHAVALIRCLRQAVKASVTFYRPGTGEVSFDEAWLMRAIACRSAGDTDSFSFLIQSRVERPYRRQVAFLISGISARLGSF